MGILHLLKADFFAETLVVETFNRAQDLRCIEERQWTEHTAYCAYILFVADTMTLELRHKLTRIRPSENDGNELYHQPQGLHLPYAVVCVGV